MSEQDYQINVRQVTVGDALKTAGAEMDQVKQKATELGETSEKTAKGSESVFNSLGGKIKALGQIFSGLRGAANGSIEGIRRAFSGLESLVGGAAVKIGGTGLVALAAWKAGGVVFEALWEKIVKVGNETGSIRDRFANMKKALDDLDKTKLDNLKKALEEIAGMHAEVLADLNLTQKRASDLQAARHQAEQAEVDAMPEGPDKTRRMAELQARQSGEKNNLTASQATERIDEATRRRMDAQSNMDGYIRNARDAQAEADRAKQHYEAKVASGGEGGEAAKIARRAQEAADRAAKERDANLPENKKAIEAYNREIYSSNTDIAGIPFQDRTSKYQYRKGMGQASAQDEAIRQQREEEAARAAIDAKRREEEDKLSTEGIEQAGLESKAGAARRQADAFKVDPRLKGKNRALAQSKDTELDTIADAAAQNAADHKVAIKKMQASYKEAIDALVQMAQEMKTQNKRIGSGQ